jgi:carbon monoxide dehydrogenase subunit G
MTKIESDTVTVNQSPDKIFDFLSNFHNFEKLMPEQVVNWESDGDKCSFDIKGMASLGMAYELKEKPGLIRIKKEGKAPFDFFLNCKITDENGNSKLQLVFDADLNPMLKMMAVKPLTNFLNMLVSKFKELSQNNDLEAFIKR